jgi:hypothetical protein
VADSVGASTRRRAPTLAWVLVLALLVGAAAALLAQPLLAGTASTSEFGGGSGSLWITVLALVVLTGLVLALYVFFRNRLNSVSLPNQFIVSWLVIILLGVLFIVIASMVRGSPLPTLGGPVPTNSSRLPRPPPPTSGNGSLPFGGPSLPGLPGWLPYLVAIIVGVVAVVAVFPSLIEWWVGRRTSRSEGSSAEVGREMISAALERLGGVSGDDARRVILELYAQLLARVERPLGGIDALTPREIERAIAATLRVKPGTARELTQIFEEARYSTHSLGLDSVERARRAFELAIADLTAMPAASPDP